ncbi:hypothetical protein [Klebsiella pneumoniae]|uniref:hypothetical protein n=1 Tax=Klebsiella pneumoniae TaxID=573 RepID=UPI003F671121
MKIILMALLLWLIKLAVTLIINWIARERLKKISRNQKGIFLQACGGWSCRPQSNTGLVLTPSAGKLWMAE